MNIYIYTWIILLLFSCSSENLPSGKRSGGFSLVDENKQSQMISLLKHHEIPYEVDDNNVIVYLIRDQAKVLGIKRQVEYGGSLSADVFESLIIYSEYEKNRYIKSFSDAGIPYKISTYNGVEHIFWSQVYGPEVDVIRQELNNNG